MQARDFVFWLNGLFEIGGDQVKSLNEQQVEIIKTHLALVFEHDAGVKQGVGTHPAPLKRNPKVPDLVSPDWEAFDRFRPNYTRVIC